MLKGGGIGQPRTRPAAAATLTLILQHNGKAQRVKGYCSDIFAEAASTFIQQADARPFFAYLAFNCPHDPLLAPEPELTSYRAMNLSLNEFPQLGQPIPAGFAAPTEMVARVYAMVTNIDTNVGKVLKALEATRRGQQHDRDFSHR